MAQVPGDETRSLAQALGYGVQDKRIDVLRLIGQTGSISQAARAADISYKAAWQAIDTLTNLTGMTLVEKTVGGAGGGGACLTDAGKRLLVLAQVLDDNRQQTLARLEQDTLSDVRMEVSRLFIQTSMRNHIPCLVSSLEMQGQIVRVFLDVYGKKLVARITRTSAELLGLVPGLSVLALCKATAVKMKTLDMDLPVTGNVLQGEVARVSSGDQEDEVVVEIHPGLQLVGFAEAGMKLTPGKTVNLWADEAAVVVARVP